MNNQNERPAAVAIIQGDGAHPALVGTVRFFPRPRGTVVTVDLIGLPDSETGFFGFHIHEGGDCSGTGFSATGSHYNPGNAAHPQHAGDLPPLLSCHGTARMSVLTERFQIRDIIGKTVVIHSKPDDFTTQPAGASGNKIACGVIRRV